jgi:alpha-tubulin suppressor-like RCC1 family protein
VRGIVSGEDTSCAYLVDGGVACWGAGSPLGSTTNALTAIAQAQYAGSPQLAIGNYHMCWVTPGGQLVCQAAEANGVEPAAFDGDGGPAPVTLAPPAGSAAPFSVLGTTAYFTCALTPGGAVYCLGDNSDGFESNPAGDTSNVTTFTQVQLGAPALDLALMVSTGCARTVGHVLCWGDDSADETGGTTNAISEVRFADGGPLADAVQLAAGGFYHGCARLSDGHVACWGNNQEHQLGRGDVASGDGGTSRFAALVVDADGGAFGNAAYVAAGGYHTCALKTDGSLWCWGDNQYGQLGQGVGDTAARSVPTHVGH